jgi:cytochrome c peroxidase
VLEFALPSAKRGLQMKKLLIVVLMVTIGCSQEHHAKKSVHKTEVVPDPLKEQDAEEAPLPSDDNFAASEFSAFLVKTPESPTAEEVALAKFGEQLFFDPGFSSDGKVACSTCHDPEQFFTDRRDISVGVATGTRNTPSIVNVRYWTQLFWDGRATSLTLQALGPLENMREHGITRGRVAQVLFQKYRKDYEERFGAFPQDITGLVSSANVFEAAPRKPEFFLTDDMAEFTYNSSDYKAKYKMKYYKDRGYSTREAATFVTSFYDSDRHDETVANRVYTSLNYMQKNKIDEVFLNFGKAIAAYEKTLVAVNAPFDEFAKRVAAEPNADVSEFFNEDFGPEEYQGYRLFTGQAGCTNCHNGPMFSDEQYHNIGLGSWSDSIDLGRAVGVYEGFFCVFESLEYKKECAQQNTASTSRYNAGAFRTASLRNLAHTYPYMHDGRYETLRDVLEHYNWLSNKPYVGYRSDKLWELRLSESELDNLEAFLISLSAPELRL